MEQSCEWHPQALCGSVSIRGEQSRALRASSLQSKWFGPGKFFSKYQSEFMKLAEVVSTHLGYMCVI